MKSHAIRRKKVINESFVHSTDDTAYQQYKKMTPEERQKKADEENYFDLNLAIHDFIYSEKCKIEKKFDELDSVEDVIDAKRLDDDGNEVSFQNRITRQKYKGWTQIIWDDFEDVIWDICCYFKPEWFNRKTEYLKFEVDWNSNRFCLNWYENDELIKPICISKPMSDERFRQFEQNNLSVQFPTILKMCISVFETVLSLTPEQKRVAAHIIRGHKEKIEEEEGLY